MAIIKIENHIPNMLTLCNLLCGMLGILLCFSGGNVDFYGYTLIMKGNLSIAAYLVFAGAFFDLLDGGVAKLLKVSSLKGKYLDSLADVVTFGVLPACIVYVMLMHSHAENEVFSLTFLGLPLYALSVLFIVGGGSWRLATFTADDSQSTVFKGMPIPANGIFFASLPLIFSFNTFLLGDFSISMASIVLNPWLLMGLSILFCYLMNSKIRMFSFKLNGFSFNKNKTQYIFLAISLGLFVLLFWLAIPLIILMYVMISIFSGNREEKVN